MTRTIKHPSPSGHQQRDNTFVGVLLIGIGLVTLLLNTAQFSDYGLLVLPALGIIFLAWGLFTHHFGFMIPGSILTCLGIAVFIVDRNPALGEPISGGIVVMGLGFGFLGISLVAPFFPHKRTWWPLIPAGILGFIGALLLIGGPALTVLEWLGTIWPLILVAIGAAILLAPRLRRE